MANKISKTAKNKSPRQLHSDVGYKSLLTEIKSRLKNSQLRAAISVNHELISFYWEVGKLIIDRQEKAKWGDKLFDILADDLRRSFPNTEGFSKTNLKNMYLFAQHYPNREFGQALPDQLTWTHHIVLARMLSSEKTDVKQWYAEQTLMNGWPYRELQTQIKADLYGRQKNTAIKTTNFKERLPSPTSQLAEEMIKDPYKFHFLTEASYLMS